jgi:hypothetical protein
MTCAMSDATARQEGVGAQFGRKATARANARPQRAQLCCASSEDRAPEGARKTLRRYELLRHNPLLEALARVEQ